VRPRMRPQVWLRVWPRVRPRMGPRMWSRVRSRMRFKVRSRVRLRVRSGGALGDLHRPARLPRHLVRRPYGAAPLLRDAAALTGG